eukprot:CAMPEP_0197655686 /NCGR_PEP_ID=MMETSP1338-20131121/39602_1 /TAXON_ID=43686 ORGANISM="Pelagodinium beii, Strain RCC1491" /NCGR_SAMPLE_ID=MMETSP1338 /ASSEMBLY_ACC=CAM_ASM_000754 /LENGTH=439 /DNA_ID=CAMNT_0043231385 /DNA_START=188 /DNA_END=1507 /DNA_ORIENTATION=+
MAGLLLLPLDLSQLCFAVLGAAAYTVCQCMHDHLYWHKKDAPPLKNLHIRGGGERTPRFQRKLKPSKTTPRSRGEARPVVLPLLSGRSWEADLQLLLEQTIPSTASETTVSQLTEAVKNGLRHVFPTAEVSGYLSCDLCCSRGFRVAVPDLEVVISMSPEFLEQHLQTRLGQQGLGKRLDSRQLEKAAIRTVADSLVSAYGFKFRRSAFKREEPKLTLLAPASLGEIGEAVPVDISVNAVTPIHNSALLAECGQLDSRAKELMLLIKRWAKDRGISHDAKGHLSPYHWSLLVIYFLQVDVFEEGAILPPLFAFKSCRDLLPTAGSASSSPKRSESPSCPKLSTAQLFKNFMYFYSSFDWDREMVGPLMAQRSPPSITTEDCRPCIQDPFRPSCNLAAHVTLEGFQRLQEEIMRASALCKANTCASDVFEAWTPPNAQAE